MQLSDKYLNVLKEIGWNDAYLILGQEYQYEGYLQNKTTHISSMAMNVGIVDMNTFSPWPYKLRLYIYDTHLE